MNRFLCTAAFLFLGFFSIAQQKPSPAANTQKEVLSQGAQLLFSQSGSKLTAPQKNAVFRMLGLKVGPDKKEFVMDGFAVGAKVYPTDMNNDNVEEVFVVMDGFLFGNTGQGVALFMKNSAGTYEQQEEIAGGIAVIMDTKSGGYPNLVIAGPGFEFPLYRWNGKSYIYVGIISDDTLQNSRTSSVEDYSRMYRKRD